MANQMIDTRLGESRQVFRKRLDYIHAGIIRMHAALMPDTRNGYLADISQSILVLAHAP